MSEDQIHAVGTGPVNDSPSVESSRFVLDASALQTIYEHLRRLEWCIDGQLLSADRIGDGNMNMTVRIRSDRSSYILKQARPWVVKYPHIPAPIERAAVEAAFYEVTAPAEEVASRMPCLFGFDASSHLLWLEDMGEKADLMGLYRTGGLSHDDCIELTLYLVNLHSITVPSSVRAVFQNRAMRALNHEHQYDFPLLGNNGLDLDRFTPGLAILAERLKVEVLRPDR